jgi:hypothetical protein
MGGNRARREDKGGETPWGRGGQGFICLIALLASSVQGQHMWTVLAERGAQRA